VSGDSVQVWSEGDNVRRLLPVFAVVIGIAAVVADPSSAGDVALAVVPAAAFAAWAYLRNVPLLPIVLGVVIPVVVAQRDDSSSRSRSTCPCSASSSGAGRAR
jgi:hypothetical protein